MTERTAKPRCQASAPVKKWLLGNSCRGDVLDFGCGRLRYVPELAAVATTLTLVDSKEQLSRKLLFDIHRETIMEQVARRWPAARALDCEAFVQDRRNYDFILCANVLSAIPSATVRRRVICLLSSRLKSSGRCLFVTHFRNTYYRDLQMHPGAARHLDGLLVKREGCSTFYGLLPKTSLIRLVERCGMRSVEAWIDGESAYVLCRRSE